MDGKEKEAITKDMTLGDVVSRYPEAAMVMVKYGLLCIGCHVAAWESIEDGARSHGISGKDLKRMLEEMNRAVREHKGNK